MKVCSCCNLELPATPDFFVKDRTKKDGLYSSCKNCRQVEKREKFPDGLRRCSKCKQIKSTSDFYTYNIQSKSYWCKDCCRTNAMKFYVPSNRVYMTKEEGVNKKREGDRRYSESHKDKIRVRVNAWVEKNRQHVNKSHRIWNKEHPGCQKAKKARRRAREANAPGEFSANDVMAKFSEQKGLCFWCNVELSDKWHIDHYIPLARNGTNYPDNIVISCPRCNLSRRDLLPEEFARK